MVTNTFVDSRNDTIYVVDLKGGRTIIANQRWVDEKIERKNEDEDKDQCRDCIHRMS